MPRRIKTLPTWLGALFFSLFFCLQHASAQVRVSGLITDIDNRQGIPNVSIINKKTRTGALGSESGRFEIDAMPGDTLEFSMLTYEKKYVAVPSSSMFINVYMTKRIIDIQRVDVRGRNYVKDSAATRQEYAKYFGYKKPGAMDVLKTLPSHPITALTYLVPSKTRKRNEHFKEQLVYWEKEKYIDNRYSPELVERMTHLNGTELDSFMMRYRPGYQFMQDATEYDLMVYIKNSYAQYQKDKATGNLPPVKKEEEQE
ncbi:carboxypeptidase-like regulatory domain-containing protein [Chitinophaga sancti]|uniref:carboxypeptidase-like regulatory domain-containing protein n=1 Tax=Chitinophaga sancti TaxID=1004 RepID=UPI002A74EA4A|nr:carboxypeptidase-like regulatory domain-containing protein [Chitinophaga sancti]WPQ63888.1 carboxypeptidase-like regulatory domain-containing protein [Chitinophaga sancti]